ncbi:hypothetical protein DAPPUDRAFT_262899 [Daphnia pulex]|uniref:Uncharacterized protein n=1 Tax=Daphnia pulex TaxID=6669 RepID=E9HNW4_DAPPU|nr:hypothetical protein DAPPUDRAFT_262899 [Daphnia pulex]|eukprot:EFX66578.1 hypothetical protein DAPPUDRAFT_262899 [Daphnia pulex]
MSQFDHPEFASKWTGDCDDNPYIECPFCNVRFYREEKNTSSLRSYHPVKDIWFSQALNAIESLKEKLKQMEAERAEIMDRHATALEEARKFFSDLAEKTMSEARTINHFYHKFYRCSEKGNCYGRITVLENGTFLMTNGHNGHPNKRDQIERNAVVNEMMTLSRDTRQSMRSIFEEVRQRNPNVAIGYDARLQRKMQRARRSNQPAVPTSVDEAEAYLNDNQHYNMTNDGNSHVPVRVCDHD